MESKSTCSMWIESYRGKTYTTRVIDKFGERFPESVPEPKKRKPRKKKTEKEQENNGKSNR